MPQEEQTLTRNPVRTRSKGTNVLSGRLSAVCSIWWCFASDPAPTGNAERHYAQLANSSPLASVVGVILEAKAFASALVLALFQGREALMCAKYVQINDFGRQMPPTAAQPSYHTVCSSLVRSLRTEKYGEARQSGSQSPCGGRPGIVFGPESSWASSCHTCSTRGTSGKRPTINRQISQHEHPGVSSMRFL